MVTLSWLTRLPCFLNSCQAVSLPVLGRYFMWKKRIHDHIIYEKLDCAIGRHDWCCQYPNCSVSTGPFTCSYHSYILFDTNPAQFSMHKSLFRYQPNWSSYDDVQRIIRTNWTGRFSGTPMFRLTRKLCCIKRDLKTWSASKFSNFSKPG